MRSLEHFQLLKLPDDGIWPYKFLFDLPWHWQNEVQFRD
jgi:hypothetical protein